ncbi:hypothetical protein V2J09_022701 [Rumex salicifolius]
MLSYIPRQDPHDRPDIMTRVFKLKLKQRSKNLKKQMIFGKTQACACSFHPITHTWLPHAHILLWMQRTSRTTSAAEIDDIISAEIPCTIKYPKAHKLVTEYMVHGPCGIDNMKSACMVNQRMQQAFLKALLRGNDC